MMHTAHTYDIVLGSPLGQLGIQLRDQRVSRLDYLAGTVPSVAPTTAFGQLVVAQLTRFFKHPEYHFHVTVDLQGTEFQHRVWQALTQIPAGETLTYGELAARLNTGARAVGNACRKNPVSIIVPCHRVVSATGIGGYSGRTDGLEINRKLLLLQHERIIGPALKIRQKTPMCASHTRTQRNLHA
jgi:methylated-DNA-[protein]-cysteine S-methyltransferase